MALVVDDSSLESKCTNIKLYLDYYNKLGQPLVDEYSSELDEKVLNVKSYLEAIRSMNLDFDVVSLQKIVIDLSSCIYYTTDKLEKLNLLADMSKIKYKDVYNSSYLEKQGAAKLEDRKYTTDQLKALAESESLEDNLINFIYERAAAVLDSKLDAARELLKATSKCLSAQIQSMQTFNMSNKYSG